MVRAAILIGIVLTLTPSATASRAQTSSCPETAPVYATTDPENTRPVWSPDGLSIAFVSNRTGNSQIYVMHVADCSVRQITSDSAVAAGEPDWSPQGRRLVFVRQADQGDELWVVNADGSGLRRLTRARRFSDGSPSWSPSGTRIAFDRDFLTDENPDGTQNVWVVRVDRTGLRRLTRGGLYNVTPAWSPRGRLIAWGHDDEIWSMRPDGRGKRRVTRWRRDHNGDDSPSWAPDGRRLAFERSLSDAGLTIHVVSLRGGRPRSVARGWDPDWSPNGQKIVFAAATGRKSNDLFLVNPDGSGLVRLTVTPTS